VFVTENPSVIAAAATAAGTIDGTADDQASPIRLLCTVGTPSAIEAAAIARLAGAGWQVAVVRTSTAQASHTYAPSSTPAPPRPPGG